MIPLKCMMKLYFDILIPIYKDGHFDQIQSYQDTLSN